MSDFLLVVIAIFLSITTGFNAISHREKNLIKECSTAGETIADGIKIKCEIIKETK